MERFSNVVLGTRSFTEGNIEGHRGTTIFYRGSFAKTPMFEGHDYFPIGNKWDYPKGACVNSVFDFMHFSLIFGGLLVGFILPYTLITTPSGLIYKKKLTF